MPCAVTSPDCGGYISTITEFPPACTGAGFEVGCTRLVAAGSAPTGPHRVVCVDGCSNGTYCVSPVPDSIYEAEMKPLILPLTADIAQIAGWVNDALDGMSGLSIDAEAASGDCEIFRHMTVQSGLFGFLDDFWICVRQGPCTVDVAGYYDGWHVVAQGQLRVGVGDIGQNFRHIQEFETAVKDSATAAGIAPMPCSGR